MDDNINKMLDSIFHSYVVWRDYYLSENKDGAISNKEWTRIRDKIQGETRDKINALIEQACIKARTDELKKLRFHGESNYLDYAKQRIIDLKVESTAKLT